MKKAVIILLVSVFMLSACTAKPADTTAVVTEPETEPITEEVTQKVLTYEENLAEIYRKTKETVLPIGGFLTPTNPQYTAPVFSQLIDGGINFMVTCNEFYGTVLLCSTLRAADQTGMDLCIWTFGPEVYPKNEIVEKLKLCLEHNSVKSIYMQDEPLPASFGALGRLKDGINSSLGAYMDWKIGANMFPDGVFKGHWTETVDQYMNSVEPDYLCFDNYPWAGNASYMGNYLGNLGEAKLLADKYGKELWTFLQTSDTGRLPNEAELRYQTNASLAMGTDAFICFTACGGAMFTDDGKSTSMFESAKAVFNDIHAMKGVYLGYSCDGLMVIGDKEITNSMKEMSKDALLDEASHGALASVTSKHALVGCFKNAEGKEAFYAVNPETDKNNTVILNFDGEHKYQIWGKTGLLSLGTGALVTLELTAGDGAFVMLDTENDAYVYTEPEAPTAVPKPVYVTAEQNALVFDLGLKEDGTVYNKVENGMKLRNFSKGTYKADAETPSITSYNIYTDDTRDVIKNGVTVELYMKFAVGADKKWVTVFRDPDSNLNLYRLCDSAHRKTKDTFYFGVPSGDDVVLREDINTVLPNEKWLHIIAVQSEKGQYVYVNGKLIAEGHFPFEATEFSNFFFVDPDGVVELNTARIYTYAATEEQVKAMVIQ